MASTIWVLRRMKRQLFGGWLLARRDLLLEPAVRSIAQRPDDRQSPYGSATPSASSFSARAPSVPEPPYSFSLLCKVFKLIPRISAARVLLLLVDSRVLIISNRSASPTVVPTPTRMESASSAEGRTRVCPNPGGKCFVSTIAPSQTITARSSVLRSSRTFPGQV